MHELTFEKFIDEYILQPSLQFNATDEALLSTPLLKREARRRGWEVSTLSSTIFTFSSEGNLVGGIHRSIPSIDSDLAVQTSELKHASKQAFANAGLPIAEGQHFSATDFDKAVEYFESVPKPLVVKASKGWMGSSVTVNVSTLEDLEIAWAKACKGKGPKAAILLEQQFDGIDIRAYVVDGEMVAAVTRVPAFVVGDGAKTIAELIERFVEVRKVNAYMKSLTGHLFVDDRWLAHQGVDRGSVLEQGRIRGCQMVCV